VTSLLMGEDTLSPSGDDNHAIDILISQRPAILRAKLAVYATQIYERLRLRANNLDRIQTELLAVSNGLLPFEDTIQSWLPLDESKRRMWLEQQARLNAELRSQEIECWRDVAQAMNDFLVVWEAAEQSRVRGEFLQKQARGDS
jgi:hypothetical protein